MIERILSAISDVMGVPPAELSLESAAADFKNWDSLNMLNLAVALESSFEVAFTPEEMSRLQSVRQIVEIVRSKGVTEA
jgi:acyl carrier protein